MSLLKAVTGCGTHLVFVEGGNTNSQDEVFTKSLLKAMTGCGTHPVFVEGGDSQAVALTWLLPKVVTG